MTSTHPMEVRSSVYYNIATCTKQIVLYDFFLLSSLFFIDGNEDQALRSGQTVRKFIKRRKYTNNFEKRANPMGFIYSVRKQAAP